MLQRLIFLLCVCVSTLILSSACSGDNSKQALALDTPPPNDQPEPPSKDKSGQPDQQVCSALDFENVTWPAHYTPEDEWAFSIALNITGSFEGHAGWSNLSNNFDGQGVSMGILNQNLGQGTLQPLMITMRDSHLSVLQSHLTQAMLDSMFLMLANWEKANPLAPLGLLQFIETEREYIGKLTGVDKKYGVVPEVGPLMSRSNSASVRWAKNTLYSDSKGRKFKPEWEKAFKGLTAEPAYVSLQIQAAQELHDEALESRSRVGWRQIRSYLLLFDFVVQNGGLKDKHFNKFARWKAQNPSATEQEQMLEMLEIRVVDSHPKWQKDVRRRKTAVILGKGEVHGEQRDLPTEYCYDQESLY